MYQKVLVGDKIEDGQRLVDALDKSGHKPTAALWYYNVDTDEWRLALSLPIVDEIGHLKAYEKIRAVLLKLDPPPRLTLSNISVQSSHSPLVATVRSAVGPKRTAAEGLHFVGKPVNYSMIEDVHIYRI